MGDKLRNIWNWLSSGLWFVPSLMILLSFILAAITISIDARLTGYEYEVSPFRWLYTGGAEGARLVLSTIAGSMISIAALTFSMTLVTMTLASSQYGHRLLRSFTRDLGNQVVLGTFTATFTYALVILRFIRDVEDTRFIPHLSLTVAMGLALVSIGVLIYFIHHVVTTIRIENLVTRIAEELCHCICRLTPPVKDPPHEDKFDAVVEKYFSASTAAIPSNHEGYVQSIDYSALLKLAQAHEFRMQLFIQPGQFVIHGDTMAVVSPPQAALHNKFIKEVHKAVIIGRSRTATQDIAFGIEQLSEIAVRALSPGINAPYTAIICIDRLAAVMVLLVQRSFPAKLRYDDSGELRLITPQPTYADLFSLAIDTIRTFSGTTPIVTIRLMEMIGRIGQHAPMQESIRVILRRHAVTLYEESQIKLELAQDRETIAAAYNKALQTLAPAES